LAEVEQAGGWRVVLARIASGEPVADIARSFGVSRSFFSRLLHEGLDRHALVVEARWRAEGDALLLEAAEMIGGFSRADAQRLRVILGEQAAVLDRATLATLDRLRTALQTGADLDAADLGRLFIESARAASRRATPVAVAASLAEVGAGVERREENGGM